MIDGSWFNASRVHIRARSLLALSLVLTIAHGMIGCSGGSSSTAAWPNARPPSERSPAHIGSTHHYGVEFKLLDFRDTETRHTCVVGAMRKQGAAGYSFAMASVATDPSREILISMRPVGRQLRRCEGMRVTSGTYVEEHAIDEVATNGSLVRYRLSLEDVIRTFLGEESEIRICDRQITLAGSASRLFRRFALLTIIRMEQERIGSAGEALRTVGASLQDIEAPGLQLQLAHEGGTPILRVGTRARGRGNLQLILTARPRSSPDLEFSARDDRMPGQREGCADPRPAFEADAMILRASAAEPDPDDPGRALSATLSWSSFVSIGLAESVRFEYCEAQWQLPAGALGRLERFALLFLALRADVSAEARLQLFPSLQIPPAEERERPTDLTGDPEPSGPADSTEPPQEIDESAAGGQLL